MIRGSDLQQQEAHSSGLFTRSSILKGDPSCSARLKASGSKCREGCNTAEEGEAGKGPGLLKADRSPKSLVRVVASVGVAAGDKISLSVKRVGWLEHTLQFMSGVMSPS
ncbi:hypothetical protein SRHO_G00165200 [Serrasalmus rhombeus]